jgi:hypothetical protein
MVTPVTVVATVDEKQRKQMGKVVKFCLGSSPHATAADVAQRLKIVQDKEREKPKFMFLLPVHALHEVFLQRLIEAAGITREELEENHGTNG